MKKTAIIANYGKTKIGSVLISLINGEPFIITGGKKAMSSGPAHLASMLHGWNYTGTETIIDNYHDITDDELNHLCGGNMEYFRKAQTDDVSIECIEPDQIRLRDKKIEDAKIQQIMQDQKNNPSNYTRSAEFIKTTLDEIEQNQKKSADERIAEFESEKVPIWSIFSIATARAKVLIKEFQIQWKQLEQKVFHQMAEQMVKTGDIHIQIYPHHLHDYFVEHLPANEYAFVMFICGQEFIALQKKLELFLESPIRKMSMLAAGKFRA